MKDAKGLDLFQIKKANKQKKTGTGEMFILTRFILIGLHQI